ncbi:MAG: hypothetical protein EZS28_039924, partial [Streblomastix strix]
PGSPGVLFNDPISPFTHKPTIPFLRRKQIEEIEREIQREKKAKKYDTPQKIRNSTTPVEQWAQGQKAKLESDKKDCDEDDEYKDEQKEGKGRRTRRRGKDKKKDIIDQSPATPQLKQFTKDGQKEP